MVRRERGGVQVQALLLSVRCHWSVYNRKGEKDCLLMSLSLPEPCDGNSSSFVKIEESYDNEDL